MKVMTALWTESEEAAAILATFADRTPTEIYISRSKARGSEMEFDGWVYVGDRIDALDAIHKAAFKAVDGLRPWDRDAVREFAAQPTVQDAIGAVMAARHKGSRK